MSAITSGLEKPTKGFNVLLEENTEQEMQLVERKEDKKKLLDSKLKTRKQQELKLQ